MGESRSAAEEEKKEEATILPFAPPGKLVGESAGDTLDPRDLREQLRMIEAILFASSEPVSEKSLRERMPDGIDFDALMSELQQAYAGRGVNVVRIGGNWAFRTADDLGFLLQKEATEVRKLSRAALEVLATIAYHQPVTRAEIEEIRGVSVSRGTVDLLMEQDWIRIGRRRMTPGRPVTFVVTEAFLDHFGLESTRDLPGIKELRDAGLLDNRPPPGAMPGLISPDGEDDGDWDEDDDQEEMFE